MSSASGGFDDSVRARVVPDKASDEVDAVGYFGSFKLAEVQAAASSSALCKPDNFGEAAALRHRYVQCPRQSG